MELLIFEYNSAKPTIGKDNRITDRVKFSGDSGYSGDSIINIKYFAIGYSNIMCST